MKRFHEEVALMDRRWRVVVAEDQQFRTTFPAAIYRNSRVERGGKGRMRKHRLNEGCGCSMCQWEKWTKGHGKRKQAAMKHELLAEGVF